MALEYRTGQNLCSAACPVQHIDIPTSKDPLKTITKPKKRNGEEGSWPDIRGLHSLQYSRDEWLNQASIEVSIKVVRDGLPEELGKKIDIVSPGVDARSFHQGSRGQAALNKSLKRPMRRMFLPVKNTEYSIWPVNTDGNHWILVIVHKRQRADKQQGMRMTWIEIAQMAVIDPFRGESRTNMVYQRMRQLLRNGGFVFAKDFKRTVWTPLQADGTSCGPRAYWCAKQILDRLLALHENNVDYDESLWDDLSGWFNEGFERGEMIGRNAWEAVIAMDYNARVAVEVVNNVQKHDQPGKLQSAKDIMSPGDMKGKKPEKRPQSSKVSKGKTVSIAGTAFQSPPVNTNASANYATPPPDPQLKTAPGLIAGLTPSSKPIAPVPNKHKVAPGVELQPEIITIDDDDPASTQQKGPAWPPAPLENNKFIPPKSTKPKPTAEPKPKPKPAIVISDDNDDDPVFTQQTSSSKSTKQKPTATTSRKRPFVDGEAGQTGSNKKPKTTDPKSQKPQTSQLGNGWLNQLQAQQGQKKKSKQPKPMDTKSKLTNFKWGNAY